MPALSLALHFIRREIRNRYLGSFSGGLWALFQPLLQLAVYGVVFVYVFKARSAGGSDAPPYVPFLVMGMWPWFAFSEAITRSTTVIQSNAALIGKVAMPREVLVIASVSASFILQGIGFCAICVAMRLFGVGIDLLMLPFAMLVLAQLYLLTLGFSFVCAAVQVFVRDLSSAMPQLLMLWMFSSPIFYSRELLPPRFRPWMGLNPFTHYPESFRALLLDYGSNTLYGTIYSLAVALTVLFIGYAVFRRLQTHFEDFL